jgi:hypothetical protein
VRFARLLLAFALYGGAACDSQFGDTPAKTFVPNPEGNDKRIRQVTDPTSIDSVKSGTSVAISGAVVVAVDQFDETRDGRSQGTVYVSDMGSTEKYSGISLFNPTWNPGNLRVGAGDALDLRGTYTETQSIGATVTFPAGAPLVQLSSPIGSFRFEATVPEARTIDITELEKYETARPYLNMIVRVENVHIEDDPFTGTAGRTNVKLTRYAERDPFCGPFPQAPTLVNELTDLAKFELKAGTKFKSITGIVTYFCNFHLAPRSADDIVIDK